jgi:hypothetical protein
MRVSSAAAAVAAFALLLPAGASATIRQVNGATGSDSSNCAVAVCKTIQYATDQAAAGDTIEIAAGTYEETVETFTTLEWVGAGTEATIVRGADGGTGTGGPAFYLKGGGSLSSLRAEGGKGGTSGSPPFSTGHPGGPAILFEPSGIGQDELDIEGVDAIGGTGGEGSLEDAGGGSGLLAEAAEGGKTVTAVQLGAAPGPGGFLGLNTTPGAQVLGSAMSATFIESEIESGGGPLSTGFRVAEGAAATLETTSVAADFIAVGAEGGFLTLKRSFIDGGEGGLIVTPVAEPAAEATIIDSVVLSEGTTAQVVSGTGSGVSRLTARGSDIITGGGPGAALEAESTSTELTVNATLHNTLVADNVAPQRDLFADGGRIDAQYSSFTVSVAENGGIAPTPGSGTNISGPPGITGGSSGGAVFLATNSPLIDRGDPSIVEPGETDFEGGPRSIDGNHDCIAAPDIGALEVGGQSSACPPPPKVADAVPVVSDFSITNRKFAPKGSSKPKAKSSAKKPKKGTRFTYSLSEPAKVAILIERRKAGKGKPKFAKVTTLSAQQKSGKQSMAFSGLVKGKPLKPGKYRATITATDSAGQASAPHQLSFQVVIG